MDKDIMFYGEMLEMIRPASQVEVKEISHAKSLGSNNHLAFEEMRGTTATNNNHCK